MNTKNLFRFQKIVSAATILIMAFSPFTSLTPIATAATGYLMGAVTPEVTGALQLSISGSASANPYAGNDHTGQQFVTIDWGETVGGVPARDTFDIKIDTHFNTNFGSGKTFNTSWIPISHTYSSAGIKTILVKVHHENFNGNEGDASEFTTNVYIPPAALRVIKHVINDNEGIKVASDFTINITGNNATPTSFSGSENGTTVSLDPGSYSVSENQVSGYSGTSSTDCSGTVASGQTKICTITNNDIAQCTPTTEICNGIDDDCDGQIDEGGVCSTNSYYCDNDQDTYLSAILTGTCNSYNCVPSGCSTTQGNDCNDSNAAIHPGATEICNGIDDNCNNQVDEGVKSTFYQDSDGDTYGNAAAPIQACSVPTGYVLDSTDCNDENAAINPGATEICNGIDDNCNQQIDEGGVCPTNSYYCDSDRDNYLSAIPSGTCDSYNCVPLGCSTTPGTDCNDGNALINPSATEICDGADNDCDTYIDEGVKLTFYQDSDGDTYGNAAAPIQACSAPTGYVLDSTDCNDENAAINPGATEVCNGIDDNCNQQIDEGVQNTYYLDADGDNYGSASSTMSCTLPQGYATNDTDCNDADASINPGATEVCNGVDDNCNQQIDEGGVCPTNSYYCDNDQDTYLSAILTGTCNTYNCVPSGCSTTPGTDCNDSDAAIHPGATEICGNGIDEDCSGADLTCPPTPECTPQATNTCPVSGQQGVCSVGIKTCDETGFWGSCIQTNSSITEICGNGIDEDCNGSDLQCLPQPVCGNGVLESGEACDNGTQNGQACSPACNSNCSYCSAQCTLINISGSSCGGGSIGGGGVSVLIIFNEANGDILTNTAIVMWFTSLFATTRVVYDTVPHYYDFGITPNYGYAFSTPEDSTKVTFHTVVITGLTPGTTYYWRAISHGSGEVWGQELSFNTTIPSIQTPPGGGTEGTTPSEEGTGGGTTGGTGETGGTGTGGITEVTQPPSETGTGGTTGEQKSEGESAVGTNAFLAAIGNLFNTGNWCLIINLILIIALILVAIIRNKKIAYGKRIWIPLLILAIAAVIIFIIRSCWIWIPILLAILLLLFVPKKKQATK